MVWESRPGTTWLLIDNTNDSNVNNDNNDNTNQV